MRTILDATYMILVKLELPIKYWPQVIYTTTYFQNLILLYCYSDTILAKIWFKKQKSVSYF